MLLVSASSQDVSGALGQDRRVSARKPHPKNPERTA